MSSPRPNIRAFTLIELMVALAVMAVLAAIALPSFQAVRQRAALRGSAEQAMSFWNQARLEAAKRNKWVKVGFVQSDSGTKYCIGAALATGATDAAKKADTTPCNCLTSTTSCDVARFGDDNTAGVQNEWRGVTLRNSGIGGSIWPSPASAPLAAVIEPKRAALAVGSQAGAIEFTGPSGPYSYHLKLNIDAYGRAVLCQPSSDAAKLSDYNGRQC